jgi:hypothetical protein
MRAMMAEGACRVVDCRVKTGNDDFAGAEPTA